MWPLRLAPLVAVVMTVPLLAACGDTEIDGGKVESLVRENLTGPPPREIDCPDGRKAKEGETLDCRVVYADGTGATVTVHVVNDDGEIRVGPEDFKPQR